MSVEEPARSARQQRAGDGPSHALPGDADLERDERWFADLGLSARRGTVDSTFDASIGTASVMPSVGAGDRRVPGRDDTAAQDSTPSTPARMYGAFALSRVLLAASLLGASFVGGILPLADQKVFYGTVCAAYLLTTLLAWRTPGRAAALFTPQGALRRVWMLSTIGVDLLVFTALLQVLSALLNVAALFAVPVLMAGTLARRSVALATAALSTLILLTDGLLDWGSADAATHMMQTGLTCAGLFAIAWLTTELASRLAREERRASSSLALARQQTLLNRLVIEEMEDGILVVDREGRVRVANPAAMALLGAPDSLRQRVFALRDDPQWQPLQGAIERAFRAGTWPQGGEDIVLAVESRGARSSEPFSRQERPLRVRMRFTRRRQQELGESLCVLFIEDVRTLRLRARQDKLAAMGRVSAGIAHEIRNPLAAIGQANALLAEDLTDPAHQRLSKMVSDNVERLRRIVEDVMVAAPGGSGLTPPVIDLCGHVHQIVLDWAQTNDLVVGGGGRVFLDLPDGAPTAVRIEPDHLARVLVNLLDNAAHHGSERPGAILVSLSLKPLARASDPPELAEAAARRRGARRTALLRVASDGQPIGAEVEPRLFEPFFSTRSRGTGLGLYICRELCERHGVSIDFVRGGANERHTNVFLLRVPTVPEATEGLRELT